MGTRAWAAMLMVALVGAGLGARIGEARQGSGVEASGSEETGKGEVFSEIGDLWRERDAFYLRADGRVPKVPGVVPAGTREMVVRVEAMTRGREFPGRWTMVEVEIQPARTETVRVTMGAVQRVRVLPEGQWTAVRVPVTGKAADVKVASASGVTGSEWRFRRVRLVDDRRVFVQEGWKAERRAGELRFETAGGEIVVPSAGLRVVEAGPIRVRVLDGSGKGMAVYASGGVSVQSGFEPAALVPTLGDGRLELRVSDDVGVVERGSEGDAGGDGFDESRGAMLLRATARRLSVFVRSTDGRAVRSVALEVRGLPPGAVSVVRDGAVVTRRQRLEDGTLLLELPGEVLQEQRIDIAVEDGGK